METTRLFSWILILISTTCHLCRGNVDTGTGNSEDDVIQLNMMHSSAAYVYAQSEESDMLAIEYLAMERRFNKTLDDTWRKALCLRETDPRLSKVSVPRGLREQHLVAILAYTLETPFYSQFNSALRLYGANDAVYAAKFPFKSFQYLLTVAIDSLNERSCETPKPTYRRMSKKSFGVVGTRMKFGYFASSTININDNTFGNKTNFTIFSRYGALIKIFSNFTNEEEVLIPPYEVFNITNYDDTSEPVKITLQTVGEAWIPVRVERGSNGEMRVLRCVGTVIFAMAWLPITVLLAQLAL